MLSVIEVTCPHCGAKGQIMLPPVSTLIVGPCPECQGLVVVFCGNVLPLDKDLMTTGVVEEKREHLMSVLTEFLRERIWQMVPEEGDESSEADLPADETATADETPAPKAESSPGLEITQATGNIRSPISQEELRFFVGEELALLDNPESFRTLFG